MLICLASICSTTFQSFQQLCRNFPILPLVQLCFRIELFRMQIESVVRTSCRLYFNVQLLDRMPATPASWEIMRVRYAVRACIVICILMNQLSDLYLHSSVCSSRRRVFSEYNVFVCAVARKCQHFRRQVPTGTHSALERVWRHTNGGLARVTLININTGGTHEHSRTRT